jgi:histidyl-tRNA synthetase
MKEGRKAHGFSTYFTPFFSKFKYFFKKQGNFVDEETFLSYRPVQGAEIALFLRYELS